MTTGVDYDDLIKNYPLEQRQFASEAEVYELLSLILCIEICYLLKIEEWWECLKFSSHFK